MLMGAGVSVLAYGAMQYMESQASATSPKGRLAASVEPADMSSALNGISMVIWSLVAAKAK